VLKRILLFAFLVVFGSAISLAQEKGITWSNEDYENKLSRAIESFYATNWDETTLLLNELKTIDNSDTRIYFFEAMLPFWSYFFGGNSSEDANNFMDLSAKALTIGQKELEVNPQDTSVVLLLSGLYGYRSLVASSEKQYRMAISSGATGYSYTKVLLTMNNDDPNTLMGQGVFNYMVGSIPSEIRWMARLAGLSGDKQRGYDMLEEAAGSQSYVSNDAGMFLAYFYEKDNNSSRAFQHLQRLAKKYPSSVIFQYNIARLLEEMNNPEEAYLAYKKVLNLSADAVPSLHVVSRERIKSLSAKIYPESYRTVGYP
jgi:tetratricopeptide (TPR) repeat protein